MNREFARLQTFSTWPHTIPVTPGEMAEAGLFYTGRSDRTECAFCHGFLEGWEQGDSPINEHSRNFPDCPFVQNPLSVRNIPISEDLGPQMDLGSDDLVEDCPQSPQGGFDEPWSMPLLDLQNTLEDSPRHPNLVDVDARVGTFSNWPSGTGQGMEVLAMCGFYHTGIQDVVRCFFCDGRLSGWKREDDPWVEHARWYPNCGFLKAAKGQAFIDVIKKRFVDYGGQEGTQHQENHSTETKVKSFHETAPKQVAVNVNQNSVVNASGSVALMNSNAPVDLGTYNAPVQLAGSHETNASTSSALRVTEGASADVKQVLEENRHLKEVLTCKICMDAEANIVFLPCGHLVCCSNCAPKIRNCPVCRKGIDRYVRTFLT